jgi:uncharacterized membrane protein
MGKFFNLIGCFIIGVSIVGLFSYTAYAFETLRMYSFWLSVVAAILIAVAALADDFLCGVLGVTYQEYLGLLISVIAILLIGGVIQWVH